jgi:hypothetical protein
MKRTTAKGRSVEQRAPAKRTVRRPSRVQRGRTTVQPSALVEGNFARWATDYPWDGQHLGAGLVDISQLACECGECWGCQRRVG